MQMRTVAIITLLCANAVTCMAQDDVDSIDQRLDESIKVYEKSASDAREIVLKKLDSDKADAQKNGDLERLKQIESSMQSFKDAATKPELIDRRTWSRYEGNIASARKKVLAAYEKAISDYTKLGDIPSAEAAAKERDAFQENLSYSAPKQLPPFADDALWAKAATQQIRECAEIAEIRKRLVALNVSDEIIVFQHDNLDGQFYHCLLKNGTVVRHDGQNSAWSIVNGNFVFKTVSPDGAKTWLARWTFDEKRESFVTINQNNKSSKGKLIYGNPNTFFALK